MPRPNLVRKPRASQVDQGQVLVEVAAAYGLVLDPWQCYAADVAMGEREDERWAAKFVCLSVRRQVGKNALLEARELAGMVALGEQTIIHSAHVYATAQEHFRRISSYFENYDDLRRRVKRFRSGFNQEEITLHNGSSLRFSARTNSARRGYTADLLVLDEAQELAEDFWAALLPVTSARPNPQVWLTGTPPSPRNDGTVFTRMRANAMDDSDPRLAWVEWSSQPGDDLDDPATWHAAIPELGRRISLDTVQDERSNLTDESFARECLGLWASVTGGGVIDSQTWGLAADPASLAVDDMALGIDIDPERKWASVAVAGKRQDGKFHVELDELREGVGWVTGYVGSLLRVNPQIRAVVVDKLSAAATVAQELAHAKFRVTQTSHQELAQACGYFYDGISEGWLVHTAQPQMAQAVSMATRRNLAGAWAWNRRTTNANITPLMASTLALYGALTPGVKAPVRKRSYSATGHSRVLVPD